MAPPPANPKREQTLKLLNGPTIQITITSESGESRTWGLPKALLSHYSNYFQLACRSNTFVEGRCNKVDIPDFEPETFEMFVEFIYFGRYTYKDDLNDHYRVRDSAKAWVLGDYLDAVEFKNFAIRNLYDMYMPPGGGARPKTGVGPEMVDYCCSKTAPGSHLVNLVQRFLIRHWHSTEFICYDYKNRESWNAIWKQHSDLRDNLLFNTQQGDTARLGYVYGYDLADYMDTLTVVDETSR